MARLDGRLLRLEAKARPPLEAVRTRHPRRPGWIGERPACAAAGGGKTARDRGGDCGRGGRVRRDYAEARRLRALASPLPRPPEKVRGQRAAFMWKRGTASASAMGRFETAMLTRPKNFAAPGTWTSRSATSSRPASRSSERSRTAIAWKNPLSHASLTEGRPSGECRLTQATSARPCGAGLSPEIYGARANVALDLLL
ncbi:MAG: hypothetical protein ACI807_003505 [Paracoccaceae bacterium]|jgi:hypothetical protein